MREPSRCDNCRELVSDCECGDCETYGNSEGPECPFCGHLNRACDSDGLLYNERIEQYDCGDCGKTFNVGVNVSFSWSASRPGEHGE